MWGFGIFFCQPLCTNIPRGSGHHVWKSCQGICHEVGLRPRPFWKLSLSGYIKYIFGQSGYKFVRIRFPVGSERKSNLIVISGGRVGPWRESGFG